MEREVAAAYDNYEFHVVYQKVTQFVAVELSSIYHDVIKDRLYTDPANSPRRRSTQTTLHRLVTQLCKILSPILVFTADEAWETVPATSEKSVHQSRWPMTSFAFSAEERVEWKGLFDVRDLVLAQLEIARQAKTIGKSLDAKVTLTGSYDERKREVLRELLNVSQLVVTPNGGTNAPITVAPADGRKCERCWHWELDTGNNAAHPTLCARCISAVTSSG
jgi:isoleucyl-tRNA synthetase